MAQQITYSAKFKRDYVAASAVVIFIAIVLAEIALAISIPAYLKRENAMALEVRRLQLLDSFDGARGMSEGLNSLAPYLREHSGALTSDEIAGLQASVTEFTRIMTRLRDQGGFCREQTLDTAIYLEPLLPEEAR